MARSSSWTHDPLRLELRAIYQEAERLLDGIGCDASTDCCRFGVTGREPYPTAIERAELEHGIAASGQMIGREKSKKQLPIHGAHAKQRDEAGERRCPLLSDAGRCRVYASRPFGCRTFFCERAHDRAGGEVKLPRKELQELGRKIADLSVRFDPRDPHPAPLSGMTRLRGSSSRKSR